MQKHKCKNESTKQETHKSVTTSQRVEKMSYKYKNKTNKPKLEERERENLPKLLVCAIHNSHSIAYVVRDIQDSL